MPGVPEVDEPLAIDPLGHLLQDLDPPIVVLDEVVVCGEDRGDLALYSKRWQRYWKRLENAKVDSWHG